MDKKFDWMIIGLGWLGSALEESLTSKGKSVFGTHRSDFDFTCNSLPSIDCNVLFLNTPPLVEVSPLTYVSKIKDTSASRVIFISSTSVYGMSCAEVNEGDQPQPDSPGGKWLLEVEMELRSFFKERLLIIRPGGLIGGQRHPVYHLQGRKGIKGGNGRINLIHRDDLVAIIQQTPMSVQLVNAIAPYHPRKDVYYPECAKKLNLAVPEFVESPFGERIINSMELDRFYDQWFFSTLGD
ncbi:MAG: hypothetical protein K2P81_00855 [Bacteriovoracaceae bacterium]|nr:hypothetical protein [Bacteriovoracaceae bacterium]